MTASCRAGYPGDQDIEIIAAQEQEQEERTGWVVVFHSLGIRSLGFSTLEKFSPRNCCCFLLVILMGSSVVDRALVCGPRVR